MRDIWPLLDWRIAALVLAAVAGGMLAILIARRRRSERGTRVAYDTTESLLSSTELAVYRSLTAAVRGDLVVMVKVRVADVLVPSDRLRGPDWQAAFDRVADLRFDYVLCRPPHLGVVCAIALDDDAPARPGREGRDALVLAACRSAGLPLVRLRARPDLAPAELAETVARALGPRETAVPGGGAFDVHETEPRIGAIETAELAGDGRAR